jgi:hypothetical protein
MRASCQLSEHLCYFPSAIDAIALGVAYCKFNPRHLTSLLDLVLSHPNCLLLSLVLLFVCTSRQSNIFVEVIWLPKSAKLLTYAMGVVCSFKYRKLRLRNLMQQVYNIRWTKRNASVISMALFEELFLWIILVLF